MGNFWSNIANSGILGGIGGIIQSSIDSRTQKRNVDMTNEANMNLAKYQYSKDLEMWNRANEYNSPSAQMARFQQAGLNPNLIYGGSVSGASGNTSTSLPKFQAPQLNYNYKSPVNLMAMLSGFQNFNIKQAQTDNIRAIADTNKERAGSERMKRIFAEKSIGDRLYEINKRAKMTGAQYDIKEYEKILQQMYGQRMKQLEMDIAGQRIASYQADIMRTNTDRAIKDIELSFMKKIGMTNIGQILGSVASLGSRFIK